MLVDTNILIDHLDGDRIATKALLERKRGGRALLISTIVRAEVLSRPGLNDNEIEKITKLLQEFHSISFSDELANIAGQLRRNYRITLPDAAIAATAINLQVPLLTRNIRDFKKIKELSLITI